MGRSIASSLLIPALAAVAATGLPAAAGERPNVVLIVADDLGGRDLGCLGSRYHRTPHIDALAARGRLFTEASAASPLCSPTRASIMTGLAPARLGITAPVCHVAEVKLEKRLVAGGPKQRILVADSVTRLPTGHPTLAGVLRAAGYRTGHFGKWHLGAEPYSPLEHGFDVDVPHTPAPGPGGGGGYLAPWGVWRGQGRRGEHLEDRMADEAVAFLRENRDVPFFLAYSAFSVHSPWMAPAADVDAAAARADPADAQRNPVYAAMVGRLDAAVGRITATLEDLGLAERTIVVFTSDNGGWCLPADGAGIDDRIRGVPVTSNAPFRSGKASVYEGGTRVPLIVVWPPHVAAASRSAAVVQSTDLMPTILDLAGVAAPADAGFDGRSVAPAVLGRPLEPRPIFCHFPHAGRADIEGFVPAAWVRSGDWKLIRFFAARDDGTDRHELYDLAADVGETRDLAADRPEVVADLDRLLAGFLADTGAVVPRLNPRWQKQPAADAGE